VIHDITVTLGAESTAYPGDTPYLRDLTARIRDGDVSDVSRLTISCHAGTHLDAPAHFIPGAKTLDQYRAENFVLPALVVNIEDELCVRRRDLKGLKLSAGEAVLFRTRNSTSGLITSGAFSEQYVHLSLEAAELCVERGIQLVGLDYLSVDRYGDDGFPVHRKLLGSGVLILETVNLRDVPPGKYTLIALPLKLAGAEASPVRAILVQ
jgi:arylformamidase